MMGLDLKPDKEPVSTLPTTLCDGKFHGSEDGAPHDAVSSAASPTPLHALGYLGSTAQIPHHFTLRYVSRSEKIRKSPIPNHRAWHGVGAVTAE